MQLVKVLFSFLALSLFIFLGTGCATVQNVIATPTLTPTDTPIPTKTPTPSPTSTDTPVPTATFMPTRTMTVTPTATPDMTSLVLNLDELPFGFEEMDPAEMGLSFENLAAQGFPAESLFAYVNPEIFEVVFGYTAHIGGGLTMAQANLAMSEPEAVQQGFLSGFSAHKIMRSGFLVGLDDIGKNRIGMTVTTNEGGIPMTTEMIVFRREFVLAYVIITYRDGQEQPLTLHDAAKILDARIDSYDSRPLD